MKIEHPEIGVCGLSCRLCPSYHTDAKSRCAGCKSEERMAVDCPFIICAVKKKALEFCWECPEDETCDKWGRHREFGRSHDTFKCYQKLESDIAFIRENGVAEFARLQKIREELLREILLHFNEGRSKTYYCIAATVLEIDELKEALAKAGKGSQGLAIKEKSKLLRSIIDEIAARKGYCLKLRKQEK